MVGMGDLFLFSIVRIPSPLKSSAQPTPTCSTTASCFPQPPGWRACSIGGIVWGILGDKRGRLSVLFGSILIYSLANIGNGFVNSFRAIRRAAFCRRLWPGRRAGRGRYPGGRNPPQSHTGLWYHARSHHGCAGRHCRLLHCPPLRLARLLLHRRRPGYTAAAVARAGIRVGHVCPR